MQSIVGYIDKDILVVLRAIERQRGKITTNCLKVWDSMGGELPSFKSFCEMYVTEKLGIWLGRSRWN